MRKRRRPRRVQLARKNRGVAIARRKNVNDRAFVAPYAYRAWFAMPIVPQETEAQTMSKKSRRDVCCENMKYPFLRCKWRNTETMQRGQDERASKAHTLLPRVRVRERMNPFYLP